MTISDRITEYTVLTRFLLYGRFVIAIAIHQSVFQRSTYYRMFDIQSERKFEKKSLPNIIEIVTVRRRHAHKDM
jgi:hypothetical protein